MRTKLSFFSFLFTVLAITTSLYSQDIDSNLELNLSFSSEITDLTGNTVPIASGMETYGEDRDGTPGCAVIFTGQANEFIEVPMNASNQLLQGDEFTVSLWFKMNNTNPSDLEVVFQKGSTMTSGFEMILYDLNTPVIGDISFGTGIWDNDWNTDPNLPLDTENWHHFAMVLTSTSVKLYRDNVLRNTFDYTGNGFDIGAGILNYELGKGFTGSLDDVRMYKRALTSQEVGLLYELPGNCEQLLGTEEFMAEHIQVIRTAPGILELVNLPEGDLTVQVYDLQGRRVYSGNTISQANNLLDLSSLTASVYVLKIENRGRNLVWNQKFVLH